MTHPFQAIHSHGFVRVAACTPEVAVGDPAFNAAETLASGEQTAVKGTLWVNGYLDHEGDEKARYRITAKRVLYASGGASKTTAPAGTVAAPEPYPY